MTLRDTIKTHQIAALKNRDELTVSVLRLLWAQIRNAEIDAHGELSDEAIQKIVAKQIKQLEDAKKEFAAGGRNDLVQKNDSEIGVLMNYAPKPLTENELHAIIQNVIAQTGATSPKDMGMVMAQVMSQVAGRADGKQIQQIVQQKLVS